MIIDFEHGPEFVVDLTQEEPFKIIEDPEKEIDVTFSTPTFDCKFEEGASFVCDFNTGSGGGGEPYDGRYRVTPSEETQVLSTADKILSQNVVVNPVPRNYARMSWSGNIVTFY